MEMVAAVAGPRSFDLERICSRGSCWCTSSARYWGS